MLSEKRLVWRRANDEKIRDQQRKRYVKWYRANANSEKTREASRKRTAKWREAHPGRAYECLVRWRKAHPDQNRKYARGAKRRYLAQKAQAVYNLTETDEQEILKGGCFFAHPGDCKGPLCLAHNIPVSEGGNTTRANIFCLCRRHNSWMGTKILADILKQLPLGLEDSN